MKNIIWPNICALALIVVSFTACKERETPSEAEPPTTAVANPVIELNTEQLAVAGIEVGQPEKRSIPLVVECTGKVEVPPQSLASVYSPVAGFIQQVRHLPGDYVRKGEALIRLSHPDLIRQQRELMEISGRLGFLEQDYQRKETLVGEDATSRRAFEEARAEYQVALARYKGLKKELEMIGIRVDELEKTGDIQSSITLSAPVSGFVTDIRVNIGKLVQTTDMLYEIVDNQHLHLELQVFAKDVDRIKKGQEIHCTVPGTDKELMAEVHLVGKMIDPDMRTTMVHGHFLEEPVPVTPGTYVQAHIMTQSAEVTCVPWEAVVREGDASFVFVKKGQGFQKTPVELGRSNDSHVEIKETTLADIAIRGAYYLNGSVGEE